MQLHQLKPSHKRDKKRRVGRGGKRGLYSGHGIKGQKSRAGHKMQPAVRELIKRYPKLRGYRFKPKDQKTRIINLDDLRGFKKGELVSPQSLLDKKIITKIKGKNPKVKILSRGELKKKLIIENCQFSAKAREKIKKAGIAIK